MPAFVCDDCDKAFRSKEQLRAHRDTHPAGGDSGFTMPDIDLKRMRQRMTLRNVAIIASMVLMATLFAGTAFQISPGGTSPTGNAGAAGANAAETVPPSGYSIQSQADIPQVSQSALPTSQILDQQLPRDVHLYLLLYGGQNRNPAVLLQYNCPEGCDETVSQLASVAQDYAGWVYVAPYTDMDERIAVTGFRNNVKMDEFDRQEVENTICGTYRQLQVAGPLGCAVQ